jgi:predicted transcriptional regulator
MKINKIKHSLGELEAEIMEIVWKLKEATVRQVFSRLKKKRKVAYTTIMTIMARLTAKGVLKRKLDQAGAYIYTPTQDKQTFFAVASKQAISSLIKEFGEVAVAQFMDVIEGSNLKDLEKWQEKLKKIK